jgi:hypothetical protein
MRMLRFTTNALLYMSAMNAGLAYNVPVTGTVKMQAGNQIPLRDPAFRYEHHDRQWALNIDNFRGKWKGSTYWFLRKDDKSFDFSKPSQEIQGSCYEISFPDSETGQWKGSGLRFTNGTKILPLSRATYNSKSICFQFPGKDGNGGVGGQGSRELSNTADPEAKYAHEINFFNQRTRSMILLVYKVQQAEAGHQIILDSVGATPFRCQLGCVVGERKRVGSVPDLLKSLQGWQGERLSFGPQAPLDERRQPSGAFDPLPFTSGGVSAVLPDNLVFAAPDTVPQGRPFDLVLGCLQTDSLFKQVTIAFDAQGELTSWSLDEYRPPS